MQIGAMPQAARMIELVTHIQEHVQFPATREKIIEACNNMYDVPEKDKDWLMMNLPGGEYHHPDEVLRALGLI